MKEGTVPTLSYQGREEDTIKSSVFYYPGKNKQIKNTKNPHNTNIEQRTKDSGPTFKASQESQWS